MFRAAQANPFDEAVGKATDENLTSENWELILDVCDKVSASDTGGKDAVAALIKRLAHRNANVQLYTLELANALSQNCGLKIHKELASRSFTDALLRLAADRNTHQQVKSKIIERMEEFTETYSSDPDLGIMEQAYSRLKSQNPNLQAPSKPFKQQITAVDRQKEEEELQMALALSIKDKPTQNDARKQAQASAGQPGSSDQPETTTHPMPSGTTAATVSRVRALYDFAPSEAGELQFRKGDIIAVLESVYKDWWKGSLRGQTGIFPLNYVEKLQDPTQEEMEKDMQTEAEVFAEIKNVEKLLALLSTSSGDGNARDNDEITTLYHSTLAIRPKLIELIGKYSQKKDDFTQLNEKFIKARRDYENLLEASMSHPAQNPYARPSQGSGSSSYAPSQGGSYPPPNAQSYAPPQNIDPNRYYTTSPRLHDSSAFPQQPQSGPAPFYMIPPGSQAGPQQHQHQSQQPQPHQQHQQQQQPPPQSMSPTPYPNSAGPHASQNFQTTPQQYPNRNSVASAQELAGSSANPYDYDQGPPLQAQANAPPSSSLENNPYAPQPLHLRRTSGPQQSNQQQAPTHPPPDSSYSSPAPQNPYQNPHPHSPPPQQHPPPQHQNEYDYPSAPPASQPHQQPHQQHQNPPPSMPNYAPPGIPLQQQQPTGSSSVAPGGGQGYPPIQSQSTGGSVYSAYVPPNPSPGIGGGGGGGGREGDVSDYYR